MDNEQIKNTQVIDSQGVTENSEQIDQFIGSNLMRFDKEQVYLIFDFETSGLNLQDSKPWQLSYTVFTLKEVLFSHDKYIWWENLNMSEGAAQVTRFDFNNYKRIAQPLSEVLPEFEKYYLDNSIIKLGHNIINYDVFIHNVARKSLGLKPTFEPNLYSIDTLALARAYRFGIKPPKFNKTGDNYEFLAWQYKMCSIRQKKMKTSLGSLIKEFNIPVDESRLHDASYDIEKNIEVFKKFLWSMEI